MSYLAIDLGSSWIKWARVDKKGRLGKVNTQDSSLFTRREKGLCEITLPPMADFLRTLIADMHREEPLNGIFFSVQMHGVALFDAPCHPVTPFVTWEDTRSLRLMDNGKSLLDNVKAMLPTDVVQRTGAWLNASYSAVQLMALRQEGIEPNGLRLTMLGDAVTELLTGQIAAIHTTNACSSGLYDLEQGCWSQEMLRHLALTGLILPPVTGDVEPVGNVVIDGSPIPVYCAAGDLQASVLGAQTEKDELILNVGTGSQIIAITDHLLPGNCETRCYFDSAFVNTITHIPAGRSLNRMVDFLMDIGQRLFGCNLPRAEIWQRINELLAQNDDSAQLDVSMYFYDHDHEGRYGSIEGITNGNFYFDRILCAAYAGMAREYLRCSHQLRFSCPPRSICMIGGISKHSPVLGREVEQAFGLPVRVADVDECALAGLAQLAKKVCVK